MLQNVENPSLQRLRTFFLGSGALLLSILLNIVLFAIMLTLISEIPEKRERMEAVHNVNVVRVKRPEIFSVKRELRRQIKPIIPKGGVALKRSGLKQSMSPKQFLQSPEFPFEINPELPSGPGVLSSPSMEIVSIGPPSAKGTYGIGKGQETGIGRGIDGVYEIGEIDGPIRPLAQAPPFYPLRAKRMGIQGWVKVRFIVTAEGTVNDISVIEAKPKNIFEHSVIRSLSSWRFTPGTVQGVPVKTLVKTTIRFELDK